MLALIVPMFLVGCSSPESNARKQISDKVDAIKKDGTSYSIDRCIYSEDNDSCFIFEGTLTPPSGEKAQMEYIYRQRNNNLLIGIKSVKYGGSLLRNNNIKANTGSSADDIVNSALASSGMGLSMTIYNDLQNGSLVDITNADSK